MNRVVFFLSMFRDSSFIVDSDYSNCIVQSLSFILNFSSIVHYPLISFIINLYLWYEWFDNVLNSFMNPSAWFLSRMESYCFQL